MATLSQRLLVQAVDVRSKSNPAYVDAIQSAGDRLVAVVAAAAASRAELVADVLPSSAKWGRPVTHPMQQIEHDVLELLRCNLEKRFDQLPCYSFP